MKKLILGLALLFSGSPAFSQCSISAVATNVTCRGIHNGSINVTFIATSSPVTYEWDIAGGGVVTAEDVSGLGPGTYCVTATDWLGCSASLCRTITQPATAVSVTGTATFEGCLGDVNGSIDITAAGGSPGYTYLWSNGATTEDVSGLTPGNYSVIVRDNHSCRDTLFETIPQPSSQLSIEAEPSAVICFGADNGAINISPTGGIAPYTYNWSNGATTEDVSGIAPGNYTVSVTDAANCTTTFSDTLTEASSAVTVTGLPSPVSCFGESSGSVNVAPAGGTGPYTFLWSNGATTEDINDVSAGPYSVTVRDVNGCTAVLSRSVTQPEAPLSASSVISNVFCSADADGSVTVSPSGGTPAYSYLWSGNNATTAGISGLTVGLYTVTITDAAGCTETRSMNVIADSIPTISPAGATTFCQGGSVVLTANQSDNYSWSAGGTTQSITASASGNYTVSVVTSCGTYSSEPEVVTVNPLPPVVIHATDSVICLGSRVTLTAQGANSYYWTGDISNGVAFYPALGVTTYEVTGFNSTTGCMKSVETAITVNSCAGIEESEGNLLVVFPNPAGQSIRVSGLNDAIYDFSVRNILGQEIKAGKLSGDGLIDLDLIVPGTYYLKIGDNVRKIIKN